MKVSLSYPRAIAILLGAIAISTVARAGAQEVVFPNFQQPLQPPRVPFKVGDNDDSGNAPKPRTPRLQISGMQAGFLVNPLGLDSDDDLPSPGTDLNTRNNADFDALQLNIGAYNPYFDRRLPGDPGGLGYYKVHSQLQLLDAGRTSFCFNLQAYTPAGTEAGGIASGPTYFVPAIACFQDLGFGAGLQTYVGQNIQANSRWTDRMGTSVHYGMAVHCPVPGTNSTNEQGVFFYFQALGRYRYDPAGPASPTSMWEFVPGVQMRLNDSCWMNVAASRYNFLSCTWKY